MSSVPDHEGSEPTCYLVQIGGRLININLITWTEEGSFGLKGRKPQRGTAVHFAGGPSLILLGKDAETLWEHWQSFAPGVLSRPKGVKENTAVAVKKRR